jgi:hypothetical protein
MKTFTKLKRELLDVSSSPFSILVLPVRITQSCNNNNNSNMQLREKTTTFLGQKQKDITGVPENFY